jgi:flagellar biosynthesis/type III secretory pathway protein FliH
MIQQFDDGRAEGKAEGKEEGREEEREKILGIIMDLKSGMPADEVARKYDVEIELVDTLR